MRSVFLIRYKRGRDLHLFAAYTDTLLEAFCKLNQRMADRGLTGQYLTYSHEKLIGKDKKPLRHLPALIFQALSPEDQQAFRENRNARRRNPN